MKLTVSRYLNARTAPGTSAGNPGYVEPETTIQVIDVVIGELYEGSAVWYKDDGGKFYWSGGMYETEFLLPTATFSSLALAGQQVVLGEALAYFKPQFANRTIDFVDLRVQCRNAAGAVICGLELGVAALPVSLPQILSFKGFQIPLAISTAMQPSRVNAHGSSFENSNITEKTRILREAKQHLASEWAKTISGFQSVSVGYKKRDGKKSQEICLIFQVNSKSKTAPVQVPQHISYQTRDGRTLLLPTDVEAVGNTTPTAICTSDVKKPGCSVGRAGRMETGTIGLKVCRTNGAGEKTYYILSCYHVMCPAELASGYTNFQGQKIGSTQVVSPSLQDGDGLPIGNVVDGCIDGYIDAAIAELSNANAVDEAIADMTNSPLIIGSITTEDENQTDLKLSGRTSGLTYGKVIAASTTAVVTYPGIRDTKLYDVIMTEKMSVAGDSGAAVLTLFGQVVGLLVASNNQYSYVVPITSIIHPDKLNIEICFP